MKRILSAFIVLFALSGMSYAQENSSLVSKKGDYYLPQQGDLSIGFEANDVLRYLGNIFGKSNTNHSPDFTLINNTFVGKYMDTDNTAYRILVNMYVANKKETNTLRSSIAGVEDITLTNIDKDFRLNLGVGREWRRGSTRLQGYYGADAFIGFNRSTDIRREYNPNRTGTAPVNFQYEFINKGGLGFLMGARGFLGAEYFVLPKMALGAEYSYGIYFNTVGEGVIYETDEEDRTSGLKTSDFYIGGDRDSWNYGVVSLKLSLYF